LRIMKLAIWHGNTGKYVFPGPSATGSLVPAASNRHAQWSPRLLRGTHRHRCHVRARRTRSAWHAATPERGASRPAADQRVIDQQANDGANHRDEHAPEIEAGDADRSHEIEKKAADNGPNDAEDNVDDQSLAALAYNLASDEACDES